LSIADLAIEVQKSKGLLRSVEVKHKYTKDELLSLFKEVSDIDLEICKKNLDKAELQESIALIKKEIDDMHELQAKIYAKYRSGYDVQMVECSATYSGNEVTFTDINGEIIEQREMTESEQLQLSRNAVDAESIIRQSSKEED